MANTAKRQFIDCTPTWEGLLPMLLELHEGRNVQKDKRAEVRATTRAEFVRMAQGADRWAAHVKALKAAEASTPAQS